MHRTFNTNLDILVLLLFSNLTNANLTLASLNTIICLGLTCWATHYAFIQAKDQPWHSWH